MIYLDYNATTPLDPRILPLMLPWFTEKFGNPSSSHALGIEARRAVDRAREQVADLIGADPSEIIFTSGGSEANNLALKGLAEAASGKGRHIVISAVEHPAITRVCDELEKDGYRISRIPVTADGICDLAEYEALLRPEPILVSVMTANNETGTLQPVQEMADIARERGILFHSDAAQAAGKIPLDMGNSAISALSLAGHKFYGPKGAGALYVKAGTPIHAQIHGARQEGGLRAGTENVPLIVGLGEAAALAREDLSRDARHSAVLRDRMWEHLLRTVPGIRRNGHPEKCLPNTLNVSVPNCSAVSLQSRLPGLAFSLGAACSGAKSRPSPVLTAMGISEALSLGTFRFSTGRMTCEKDIDDAVNLFSEAVLNA